MLFLYTIACIIVNVIYAILRECGVKIYFRIQLPLPKKFKNKITPIYKILPYTKNDNRLRWLTPSNTPDKPEDYCDIQKYEIIKTSTNWLDFLGFCLFFPIGFSSYKYELTYTTYLYKMVYKDLLTREEKKLPYELYVEAIEKQIAEKLAKKNEKLLKRNENETYSDEINKLFNQNYVD
jgi:hypothetical protein